jgi:PEP-CTERM motif-containing protein
MVHRVAVAAFIMSLMLASQLSAGEIIANGGFETGTFAGWVVVDAVGSGGTYVIDDADGSTPISAHPTVGPASGNFYAVSDQDDPSSTVLIQGFTIPGGSSQVTLSYDMFVNDWNAGGAGGTEVLPTTAIPGNLGDLTPPAQFARVDILGSTADPFDTGAGVLQNFYYGTDGDLPPYGYTHYSFDITGLVGGGGDFLLRFGETDTEDHLNQGIDNVSIQIGEIPEPSSIVLFATGLAAVFWLRRRHRA